MGLLFLPKDLRQHSGELLNVWCTSMESNLTFPQTRRQLYNVGCATVGHDHNIHWLVHKPHSPDIACLLELWNVQLNEQLKPQMRGKTVWMGCSLPGVNIHIEWKNFIQYCVSDGKNSGAQEPRGRSRSCPIYHYNQISMSPGLWLKVLAYKRVTISPEDTIKVLWAMYDCCLEIWGKKKSHHLGRNNWIGSSGRGRTAVIQWRMGEIHVGPSGLTWRPCGNPLPL